MNLKQRRKTYSCIFGFLPNPSFELEALLEHPIKTHTLLVDDRRIFGLSGSNWGEDLDEEQRQDNKDQVDKYLEENLLESKI